MARSLLADGSVVGEWWHTDSVSGRVVCDLCPRECHLKDGDRGFCFVRENRGGQMVLSTYGRSTGFCIDPIEKKPLNHFYPGSSVLSFGTAGCNLGCKFCQNWEISKSREVERLSQQATPEAIALAAKDLDCRSVAFTYNDPVIWAEYAMDTARACRAHGVKSVAVTAGYIHPAARESFYETMDAANVDLKGFTEEFYWKTTNSHLAPVLETLEFLKHQTNVWFEITNLMIPTVNDSRDEVKQMSEWIVDHLGPDVPIHFTAFHPDFRMRELPNTPASTLMAAYEIAKAAGIHYVYVGNIHDPPRQTTYCPVCRRGVVERIGYDLKEYALQGGCCRACRGRIAGYFDDVPGTWGSRRQPVNMTAWSRRHASITTKEVAVTTTFATPSEPELLDVYALTDEQRSNVIELAARLITQFAHHRTIDVEAFLVEHNLHDLLKQRVFGLFTTLKRGHQLRGCCGSIGVLQPLQEALWKACQRTTLDDRRMPAISPSELPYLNLDISLLEQLEPVLESGRDRIQAFEIGKHGLYIQRGEQGGLLLPSVSVEQGWNAEEFLRGVCRKAGLNESDWLRDDCKLQRFAGHAIHSSFMPAAYAGFPLQRPAILNSNQLAELHRAVANNLIALTRGATPSYFISSVPDGTVQGLVLSLFESTTGRSISHAIQLSMRPGMPLQSTLFELTSAVFRALQNRQQSTNLQLEVVVTLLQDPAAHGAVTFSRRELDRIDISDSLRPSVDVEGVANSGRAIIAIAGQDRIVVSLGSSSTPEEQIISAARTLDENRRPIAIYSMDAISTRSELFATNVAIPDENPTDREPAVAGSFYPADDTARRAMVRKIFDEIKNERVENSLRPSRSKSGEETSPLLAIMTPHAGLMYSGRISARVWNEVDFPRRLLIIGPKHTPLGVPWGVAPHRRWKLSESTSFENDLDLAKKIGERVDGMRLDSMAHLREHGIEIQLPLIDYLAPSTRLTAIAMQSATWQEIQVAAKQLAELLMAEKDRPLLVISSDMNHYAEESENRRRDRLALDVILYKDPERLIEVCHRNQISMCGLIPAALVMQTLTEMGLDYHVDEIAYGTSGDVAKSDRVVGYAGMTFSTDAS